MYVQAVKGKTLVIGRAGEQNARTVVFDVSRLLADFPGAAFRILSQQAGDAEERTVDSEYVTLDVETETLYWSIQAEETAKEGFGRCEMVALEGEAIAKSFIYTTMVGEALVEGMDPPESTGGWISKDGDNG